MAVPTSRATLIEYCLRRLGEPVIEINVDPDQLEDRLDEALQHFREYHSEGTYRTFFKHQVTTTDIANEYIDISSDIIQVQRLFRIPSGNGGRNFFDIKYQMHLNDIADLHSFIGDLGYYEQMQQYLSLLDMKLTGNPQVNYVRNQNRLYIHGDFSDGDIKLDDYLVAEVYQIVNGSSHSDIYNDMWLKEYTTALIKQQWGSNLIKFEGMVLPGGVQLNGRQIFEDATQEIAQLRERIRLEHEVPVDFFMG